MTIVALSDFRGGRFHQRPAERPSSRLSPFASAASAIRSASGSASGPIKFSPAAIRSDVAAELGWDHAHYGLRPPLEALFGAPTLKLGYQAGLATYGRRTLKMTPFAKPWLKLRLDALACGRRFDTARVNPRYIEQLTVSHCPVTREALDPSSDDTVIARLNPNADFVAGNLLMMSRRAFAARHVLAAREAFANAAECAAMQADDPGADARIHALDAAEWMRLATLISFAENTFHASASRLPLRALPPNRLRMANAVQALQTLASRALAIAPQTVGADAAGGAARFDVIRASMPGKQVRDDVDSFAAAFRIAFAKAQADQRAPCEAVTDDVSRQWAIEDAWSDGRVMAAWERMAGHLDAARAEEIAIKAGGPSLDVFLDEEDAIVLPPQPVKMPAPARPGSIAANA